MPPKKKTASTSNERTVVIGNDGYGLYYGRITATDAEIAATKSVRVTRCRHIARWNGGPGGITSLPATGPLKGSRIGGDVTALITGVKNIFECTPEAVARFDALAPSAE